MKKEHMTVLLEDINEKFNYIVEGHTFLKAAIDRNTKAIDETREQLQIELKLVHDKLNAKIDRVNTGLTAEIRQVAADLTAHRADTEAHYGYNVAEK